MLGFGILGIAAFFLAASFVSVQTSYGTQSLGAGTSVRLLLMDATLSIYRDNPLTGAGVFVFPLVYRTIREPMDNDSYGSFVHNDYLQFLAEGGPLLVSALVLFSLATVWRFAGALFRCVRLSPWLCRGQASVW